MSDPRINKLIDLCDKIRKDEYDLDLSIEGNDDIALLGKTLLNLGFSIKDRVLEHQILLEITSKINEGLLLDDVLNYIYNSFRIIIPYDRIGVAFLQDDKLTAHWAKTDALKIAIKKGYTLRLDETSLKTVMETETPRILNDLEEHLKQRPQSQSTKDIMSEGIRSSLTCPLIASSKPIGFIFFSSKEKNTYQNIHTQLFLHIAKRVAVAIEKSRLYEKYVELNDLKNKFLGMAAHDLRNPLHAIKGNIQIIKEKMLGEVNEKQVESLSLIESTCDKMLNIINNFLDVSAIEAGKFQLKKEQVKIKEYLKKVFEFNYQLAKSKSIELKLDLEENLPEINLDKIRISQVLVNLISNAIKYSHENTTITIKAAKKNNMLEINIIDEGQGIPEKELTKLFDFFSKTSVKPTGAETSTGLGLAIAKIIVNEHGGKIWAANNPQKGCTFSFSIPF